MTVAKVRSRRPGAQAAAGMNAEEHGTVSAGATWSTANAVYMSDALGVAG